MSEERPIEDVHADLITVIADAIKTMLISKQQQPRQHKHGLMGTNPNTRRQTPVDPDDPWGMMDRGSARDLFMKGTGVGIDEQLEAWYETGKSPWSPSVSGRGAVVEVGWWPLRHQRIQQAILDFRPANRLIATWKTLRYGPDYWRDW
jgi:hypothetical protein